jgi:hypothetical protein
MSRGGASPTGWVYLRSANCTIRWQRGDKVAYIFEGKQTGANSDEGGNGSGYHPRIVYRLD